MPAAMLEPRTLTGQYVRLEPLAPEHHAKLTAIGADPALWRYMPIDAATGYPGKLAQQIAAIEAGEQMVFAVIRLSDAALVGSVAYMAIAPAHARLEIGTIWYQQPAQGTVVNPETMLLLLDYAFASGFNRVEFKADAKNARSRAAIRKLGATEEGILRQHMWLPEGFDHPGRFRDSVYYSILVDEWPALRDRLKKRLAAFG